MACIPTTNHDGAEGGAKERHVEGLLLDKEGNPARAWKEYEVCRASRPTISEERLAPRFFRRGGL